MTRVFRHTQNHLRILTIESKAGQQQTIKTTDQHPFWVKDVGWVAASDLAIGDQVVEIDDSTAVVRETHREDHPDGIPVFNFEVSGYHSYHVAAATGATPIWVHNQSHAPHPEGTPTPEWMDGSGPPSARDIKNARQRGVNRAKSAERDLVQNGHPGTADDGGWSWAERKRIAETGQYPADVAWHHLNDVHNHPELAGVADNLIPSRGNAAGHVRKYHPNGTRAGSTGDLLDRTGLKETHLNGGQ